MFSEETDPPIELSGAVKSHGLEGTGPLVLSGVVLLDVGRIDPGSTLIPEGAVVTSDATWEGDFGNEYGSVGPVDLAGTLHLQGSAYFGDLTVRSTGRLDTAFTKRSEVRFGKALDIQAGGSVSVTKALLSTSPLTQLLGASPSLVDVEVDHRGPIALTVRGDVTVHVVARGATLLVRPEGERLSLQQYSGSTQPTYNAGTLDVEGVMPTDPAELPQGQVLKPIRNTGTLRLRGVRLDAGLDNQTGGVVSVRDFVRSVAGQTIANAGRLEVGPRFGGSSPLGASLVVSGTLANTGSIVSTDDSAEISAAAYTGTGPIDTWLNVLGDGPGAGLVALEAKTLPIPVLGLGRARVSLGLGGLSDSTASRVAASKAVVDFGDPITFDVSMAAGFIPCAGSRWQLVSWPKLLTGWRVPTANPSGNRAGVTRALPTLTTSGVPAGMSVSLVERSDGFVAIASGAPAGGDVCSDAAGSRLVSGLFVDGLGRPPTSSELADFGARAALPSGARGVARELLGSEVGTRRFVDREMRRILGRPVSPVNVAGFATRLRTGTEPDVMRSEVFGAAGFYANSGHTVDGWARAFYRVEFGRTITNGELGSVRRQVAAGFSRTTIARFLLASAGADQALAARTIELWWTRPATAAEQTTWVSRYQNRPEQSVTTDLAAANPIS